MLVSIPLGPPPQDIARTTQAMAERLAARLGHPAEAQNAYMYTIPVPCANPRLDLAVAVHPGGIELVVTDLDDENLFPLVDLIRSAPPL